MEPQASAKHRQGVNKASNSLQRHLEHQAGLITNSCTATPPPCRLDRLSGSASGRDFSPDPIARRLKILSFLLSAPPSISFFLCALLSSPLPSLLSPLLFFSLLYTPLFCCSASSRGLRFAC
ncbi:hypothetical protein BO78DRAFT_181404 [Aspergillus sclerotiicarbonarius CBS 121057]|uniref:Uncharacterized protein n=1 Tax=Aspergillus sclerotiicarbonarius (strain CBS 121057 / IBT 28362) TaxID=1448318 RepID=A0A319EN26_ASPSB|nr:hypothetical protein BO78DRAFT_181404 [Aspergillus sclerotiicarbonarius CBS 121057]